MVYRSTGLQPNVYRRGLQICIPVVYRGIQRYTDIQVYRSTGIQSPYTITIQPGSLYGIQSTVYTEYTGGIQLLSWHQVYNGIQVWSHLSDENAPVNQWFALLLACVSAPG